MQPLMKCDALMGSWEDEELIVDCAVLLIESGRDGVCEETERRFWSDALLSQIDTTAITM